MELLVIDPDLPTVPESWDGPEPPRCPACGLYPDRYRATCLTCLTGGGQ